MHLLVKVQGLLANARLALDANDQSAHATCIIRFIQAFDDLHTEAHLCRPKN